MLLKGIISIIIGSLFSCSASDSFGQETPPHSENEFINTSNAANSTRYFTEVFDEITEATYTYGSNTTQGGKKIALKLDLYQPKGDTIKQRPLFIFAHGGGFTQGARDVIKPSGFLQTLTKSGYVVASISYRLLDVPSNMQSTSIGILNAVEDMRAAIRYFRKDAATANQFKIDTNQIFIGGYSAGAITALHAAYLNTLEKATAYVPFLTPYINNHNGIEGASGNPDYASTVKGVVNISGAIVNSNLLDNKTSILYSLHGTDDKIVPIEGSASGLQGSKIIHEKAEALGLTHKLNAVPNKGHDILWLCTECRKDLQQFLAQNTTK
ncbi:alpha/beta hydrolase [Aquimarina agarivorans]|uniref:alpha/beta hydrolase n=1 Tax=Aquimarina agarivorans TaxID=980584 RepID=UPI000248E81B|nr:alpha/beta hydrolase [Aquimarina agarivorans]